MKRIAALTMVRNDDFYLRKWVEYYGAQLGREKHMQKRARTICYVTDLPARDFDRWTRFARICQTLCRPPYALNKPAMLELRIVVRIPERFQDIV